jgi:hypothetical protein
MPHDVTPKIQPENPEFFKELPSRNQPDLCCCEAPLRILRRHRCNSSTVLLTFRLMSVAILWTMDRLLVKQDLIGKGGRVFSQHKLRTRTDGASEHAPSVMFAAAEPSYLSDCLLMPAILSVAGRRQGRKRKPAA